MSRMKLSLGCANSTKLVDEANQNLSSKRRLLIHCTQGMSSTHVCSEDQGNRRQSPLLIGLSSSTICCAVAALVVSSASLGTSTSILRVSSRNPQKIS